MQEANGGELPTSMYDRRQPPDAVKPSDLLTASANKQPLPQSVHTGVMPAQLDSPLSAPSSYEVPPTSASFPSKGVNLNALMEDLDRNMTQQGVSTVPKGHCSACSKPIIGQVAC